MTIININFAMGSAVDVSIVYALYYGLSGPFQMFAYSDQLCYPRTYHLIQLFPTYIYIYIQCICIHTNIINPRRTLASRGVTVVFNCMLPFYMMTMYHIDIFIYNVYTLMYDIILDTVLYDIIL